MISRDELYRLVWSEPMKKVAGRFDLSGSYLARVCAALNVPRPGRGYWAKLAVGRASAQTPLAEALPGDPVEWRRDGEPLSIPKPASPPTQGVRKNVRVAWDEVHEMLVGARANFENGRKIDEGQYLRPYKKLLVDITTSQASLEKALALANDLFNALDAAGYCVFIPAAGAHRGRSRIDEREASGKPREHWQQGRLWSPDRPTVVYVGTVAIGLAIVEMSENVTLLPLAAEIAGD